ncbi:hypothetical protein A3Q56_02182 [Intoshia linei]|uniref:HAT C-terminal dimerisation domain-containing protein n=1 Tax=Intoshia linei TaxID=1819745 RepID=A0A177B6Y9_9BILA|nr:hypothetical protein A3Q56_02182 [Intoshia linei]
MFKILIALQFLSVIMAIRNTTNHTSTHLENIIRVITPISFDGIIQLQQQINRDKMFNEFVTVDVCLKNSPTIPPWKDLCDNIDTNGFKKLIQFYYSLNCSNTYIERVFSVTNNYWTEHKSNLSLKTLKSVILFRENSKEKCTNVYKNLLNDI